MWSEKKKISLKKSYGGSKNGPKSRSDHYLRGHKSKSANSLLPKFLIMIASLIYYPHAHIKGASPQQAFALVKNDVTYKLPASMIYQRLLLMVSGYMKLREVLSGRPTWSPVLPLNTLRIWSQGNQRLHVAWDWRTRCSENWIKFDLNIKIIYFNCNGIILNYVIESYFGRGPILNTKRKGKIKGF